MTATGSVVHRRDCAIVQHVDTARTVTTSQAAADNRRACAFCDPFDAVAD